MPRETDDIFSLLFLCFLTYRCRCATGLPLRRGHLVPSSSDRPATRCGWLSVLLGSSSQRSRGLKPRHLWRTGERKCFFFSTQRQECVCAKTKQNKKCSLTFESPASCWTVKQPDAASAFAFPLPTQHAGAFSPAGHTCHAWYFRFHTHVGIPPHIWTWMTTLYFHLDGSKCSKSWGLQLGTSRVTPPGNDSIGLCECRLLRVPCRGERRMCWLRKRK